MTIRQMTAADVAAVAAIEKSCFSEPWSEQGFLAGLANSACFLVAEDECGEITGYIGMYVSVPEGEITNVAVRGDRRGSGTGNALVEAMQQWAGEHGVNRIVLEVRTSNEAAIHVYEKKDFHRIGVRRNFYRLPTENADIMEWTR